MYNIYTDYKGFHYEHTKPYEIFIKTVYISYLALIKESVLVVVYVASPLEMAGTAVS